MFTEMVCSNTKILIRFANAQEVKLAIENSYIEKKKQASLESYTVIKLSGKRSFRIEQLSPEEAIRCKLHDFPTSIRYKYYEKYYL